MTSLSSGLSRRWLLQGIGLGLAFMPFTARAASNGMKEIQALRPGEFTWHPERSPNGPLAVIVSLPRQRVHVYRNGVRIAVSTCSSGKPGHETPTGVFVILEKDRDHHSSTYDNAPMPNMNRLTWSGIALHAGNLPGYPASHGCIRLPTAFSEKLFGVTHLGTPVIIAGAPGDASELIDPGLVLGGLAAGQMQQLVSAQKGRKHPSDWTGSGAQPVVSVIASSSDRVIMLTENGHVRAQAPLYISGSSALGSHVYMFQSADATGAQWIDITRSVSSGANFRGASSPLERLTTTPEFAANLQALLHPGAVLVLTDAPLHPDTRSGRDFVIMS